MWRLAVVTSAVVVIGAVTITLAMGGGVLALIPAVVGIVAAVVAWGRRDSTRALVSASAAEVAGTTPARRPARPDCGA